MTQLFRMLWPSLELLKADIFLNMTANPKWPEIQDQLLWEFLRTRCKSSRRRQKGF